MRKYYLDNLRIICILLLFPFHTAMIYNTFEGFYIHTPVAGIADAFISIVWTFIMPLMFTISGIAARISFQKRSIKHYTKERVLRLLIPLVFGILLLVPMQTFFAEKFHNGYSGGYVEQYTLFFGKFDDLTGYTGGFTPGHLWFILYLFLISLTAIPFMVLHKKSNKPQFQNLKTPIIIAFFIIPFVSQLFLDISGKSFGEYLSLFLLGYFLLSEEAVEGKLEKMAPFIAPLALILLVGTYLSYPYLSESFMPGYDFLQGFTSWISILAFLGFGKRYLNKTNVVTDYLREASFPMYLFHQNWIIAIAYFVVEMKIHPILQALIIITTSLFFTTITYEVFKRSKITRFLFGIKYTGGQSK